MALVPDESYGLFATESLLERLQALTQEITGVHQAEDIEHIHRMRVASRRLRSAFTLFGECLPDKKLADWKKQIRAITRSLGAARDTDVQLDFLFKFLDDLKAETGQLSYEPGVQRLVLRLQQRRERLQSGVVEALDRLEASRVAEEMGQMLRERLVHARLNNISARSTYVCQQAYLAISLRLEEMLAYESYVYQPEHMTELHAMRIAAKRLRYTMEVFAPLYPDGLKGHLKIARDIQKIIGDIHDCDVWVDYLPQFLEEERVRTLEYFGHTRPFGRLKKGILHLLQERQEYRIKRHLEYVEFWKQTLKDDVWNSLRQSLHLCSETDESSGQPLSTTSEGQASDQGELPEELGE